MDATAKELIERLKTLDMESRIRQDEYQAISKELKLRAGKEKGVVTLEGETFELWTSTTGNVHINYKEVKNATNGAVGARENGGECSGDPVDRATRTGVRDKVRSG